MPKTEKITYKELNNESSKLGFSINWRQPSGEISKVLLPKNIVGTKANVIVLSPDNFPTGSSSDGVAYFNVKYMIENKRLQANTLEVLAFDSAIISYAWACSTMGVKCIIKTPENALPYWLKKAEGYGAKIEFEGVKISDASRIIDSNRKKTNFISDVQSPITYTYHANITSNAITKAVEGSGNSKVVLLSYPVSSGGFSGAAFINKKNFPYSKNILIEPTSGPTFYSNKRTSNKSINTSYGFIPYIHNIMGTDYVMLIDDADASKTLKCIEQFSAKMATEFKTDSKHIKQLVGKFGLSTVASIIGIVTLADQLHLREDDNVVIIGEDTSAPYKEIIKNQEVEEIDVKSTIEEILIKDNFRPIIDVTGQRQRERLFKKKNDFWLRRGADDNILGKMREKNYWDNLASY
jgi:cysteine synthase